MIEIEEKTQMEGRGRAHGGSRRVGGGLTCHSSEGEKRE